MASNLGRFVRTGVPLRVRRKTVAPPNYSGVIMSGRSRPSRRLDLQGLVAGLVDGVELDPVRARQAARRAALTIQGDFHRFWRKAISGPAGPIDVIDMFSGCGGMSAGFKAVNGLAPVFNPILAVDVDEVANSTYERNLGLKPRALDISWLARSKKRVMDVLEVAGCDPRKRLVLIGCAPCQGFSSHRNSAGRTDQRNSLFVDFARVAAWMKPQAIVVENVPELLATRNWPYVEEAITVLQRAGYFVHLGIHNMAEFGVPQERFRAVMLAFPHTFDPMRGFYDRDEFRTVRDAIGQLPEVQAGARDPADSMHYCAGHKQSTIDVIRAVPRDGGSRPMDVGPECLRRVARKQGKPGYEDVYGRLYWDRPAITITAYARNPASGRYVHPVQDRGLTVREGALLQGFPLDYEFSGGLDPAFRQIGNAVPPLFASALAVHLVGEMVVKQSPHDFDPGIQAPIGPSFSRLIPSLKAAADRRSARGARRLAPEGVS